MAYRYPTKHSMMIPIEIHRDLCVDPDLVTAVDKKQMIPFAVFTCWFNWLAPEPDSGIAIARVRLGIKCYAHQYRVLAQQIKAGLRLIGAPKLPNSAGHNEDVKIDEMWPCYILEMNDRSHRDWALDELEPNKKNFLSDDAFERALVVQKMRNTQKDFHLTATVLIPDPSRVQRCGPDEGYVNCHNNAWKSKMQVGPIHGFRNIRFAGLPTSFAEEKFPSKCPPVDMLREMYPKASDFLKTCGYRRGEPEQLRRRRAIRHD